MTGSDGLIRQIEEKIAALPAGYISKKYKGKNTVLPSVEGKWKNKKPVSP